MNDDNKVDLSVVLPVFNEEKNIEKLADELVAKLDEMGMSYEVIAINVPGNDDTYRVLKKVGEKHENLYPVNVRYLHTRNYQKSYQYMLGFNLSRGERVVQMDSDYQDDPADIPAFLKKLDGGFHLVVGWKQNRKDPFFYKLTSKMQNAVTRVVTGVSLHDKNCGFKAYERAAVDALILYAMNYRDIPLQLSAKGFKVAEIPINNRKRIGGKSNFNFLNRLIGGTLDFLSALVAPLLLDKPFRVFGGIGLLFSTVGWGFFVAISVWVFVTGGSLGFNWWTVYWYMVSVIGILGGILLFGLGALAEYMRSMSGIFIEDYHVFDDPKNVFERAL